MASVKELLSTASDALKAVSDTSALDARLLLQAVTGLSHVQIVTESALNLSPQQQTEFHGLLARRTAGEPVAYILGRKEFWGLDFAVTPDVLIPRPETETLVEHALRCCAEKTGLLRILDLGTGSGCIAIALAHELQKQGRPAEIVAVDKSPQALAVAKGNAERLLAPDKSGADRVDAFNPYGNQSALAHGVAPSGATDRVDCHQPLRDAALVRVDCVNPYGNQNALANGVAPSGATDRVDCHQPLRDAALVRVDCVNPYGNQNALANGVAPSGATDRVDCHQPLREQFLVGADGNLPYQSGRQAGHPDIRLSFLISDWFSNLDPAQHFDLIVSNPPYIASGDTNVSPATRFEPQSALYAGPDGLDAFRVLANQAHAYLANGGLLLAECGWQQREALLELFSPPSWNACLYKDLAGHDRVLEARLF